jgi:Phosphatidate phosphatase APP1, catalytic domain
MEEPKMHATRGISAAIRGLMVLWCFCPTAGTARASDAFILISDVDDTVKITDVLDRDDALRKSLTSEAVFAGMPELYRALLGGESPAERLQFVSGSPSLLSHKVNELLKDARFPAGDVTLRSWSELFTPAFDYKTRHLSEMYGASDAKFLLVGDDTEKDPEVYAAFAAPRQDQVLGIYIHRITGRPVPPGSIEFVTAYDMAIHEYLAGRLDDEQAAAIGSVVLAAKDDTFLPGFQDCPTAPTAVAGLPPGLMELEEKIDGRLSTLCSKRPLEPVHETSDGTHIRNRMVGRLRGRAPVTRPNVF